VKSKELMISLGLASLSPGGASTKLQGLSPSLGNGRREVWCPNEYRREKKNAPVRLQSREKKSLRSVKNNMFYGGTIGLCRGRLLHIE